MSSRCNTTISSICNLHEGVSRDLISSNAPWLIVMFVSRRQPRWLPWSLRPPGRLLRWRSWRQSSERRRTAWSRCIEATSWQSMFPQYRRPKKCAGSSLQTAMTLASAYTSTGLLSRAGPSRCTSVSRATMKMKKKSWKVCKSLRSETLKVKTRTWLVLVSHPAWQPFFVNTSWLHFNVFSASCDAWPCVDFLFYVLSAAGPVSNGDVEKGSKTQANSNLVEILPVYRQDSHLSVNGGSHDFPGDGTYLLKFDNSYSLWRNKTLYYRVYYSAWVIARECTLLLKPWNIFDSFLGEKTKNMKLPYQRLNLSISIFNTICLCCHMLRLCLCRGSFECST